MYNAKCLECGEVITSETKGKELRKLNFHLKNKHDLSVKEYVIKHEYNSVKPLCACGCGNEVGFSKWKFNKYYKDHKNKCPVPIEIREKISSSLASRAADNCVLSEKELKESFKLYKTPEFNLTKIQEKYGCDSRVIKKYWISFGIANQALISRYSKLHKGVWSNQGTKNGQYVEIPDSILDEIESFLSSNKKKVTYSFLLNRFKLKVSKGILKKRLLERFGEKILGYLDLGNRSHQEVDFGYVLKYFFGAKNVKTQFKLQRKIYDFLLYDKIIIEYDGSYWHDEISDEQKNQIALDNGYIIFRVSDKERKNIQVLLEIEKLLRRLTNETKTCSD